MFAILLQLSSEAKYLRKGVHLFLKYNVRTVAMLPCRRSGKINYFLKQFRITTNTIKIETTQKPASTHIFAIANKNITSKYQYICTHYKFIRIRWNNIIT